MNGIVLVVRGGGGAGKIVDFIHFHGKRLCNVVCQRPESGTVQQVQEILFGTRKIIVDAGDLVTVVQQAFTEMGANESGSPGD